MTAHDEDENDMAANPVGLDQKGLGAARQAIRYLAHPATPWSDEQVGSVIRAYLAALTLAVPGDVVELHILFQADENSPDLRFVEVETLDRKSVRAGTWMKRDDGYDVLALSVHKSDVAALSQGEQP